MTNFDDTEGCSHARSTNHKRGNPNGAYKNKETRSYKLFVSKVPLKIDHMEFRRVFDSISIPVDYYLSDPSPNSRFKWGFVEYSLFSDAEAIIYMLDGQPPYNFQVKFANCNDSSNGSHFASFDKLNRNREQNNVSRTGRHSIYGLTEDSSSSDVNDVVSKHRSKRDNHRQHNAIKNIRLRVNESGSRMVEAELEDRTQVAGLNHSSSAFDFSSRLVALDTCRVCKADARKKCPNCSTPYCSKECAAQDWEVHKAQCLGNAVQPVAHSTPEDNKSIQKRQESKSHPHKTSFKGYSSDKPSYYNRKKDSTKSQGNSKTSKTDSSHSTDESDNKSKNEKSPLPYDTFTEVLVVYIEDDGSIWVVSDKDSAFSLHDQLQKQCSSSNSKRIIEPKVGMLCAALYKEQNEWCRAEIIRIKPTIRVRYMDYGNEEDVLIGQLKTMSPELSSIRALAFKIKLPPGSSFSPKELNITSLLSVKPIQFDGAAWLVSLKNSFDGVSMCSNNPPIPTDTFSKVNIVFSAEPKIYWVQKINDHELSQELTSKVNNHCKTACPINPSDVRVDWICGAFYEGLWYRAKVLTIKPVIKVHFIDYGNEEICSLSDIKQLPEQLISIPPYAFKVELANGTSEKYWGLLEEGKLSVKPVKKSEDGWIVHVENEKYDMTPEAASEIQLPDDSPTVSPNSSIPCALSIPVTSSGPAVSSIPGASSICTKTSPTSPIPSSSFTEVSVCFPIDKTVYWVQKVDDEERFLNLTTKINIFCSSAPVVKSEHIAVGMICGALFDNVWFRAEVLTLKPALRVRFIDYGNEENVSISDIRKLTDEFTSEPSYAFKIKLAPGTSDKYCGKGESETFSVKPMLYEGDAWIVHVENEAYSSAVTKSKTDQITEPTPKTASDSVKPISKKPTDTGLLTPPIPTDSFTEVSVCFPVDNTVYWVQKVNDEERFLNLTTKINIFCTSAPAVNSEDIAVGMICSALFDNFWFRAEVLTVKPALRVRFIDYGNEENVSIPDIRKLNDEFTSEPSYAFKIQLAPGTSDKYCGKGESEILSVKPLSYEGDAWIVRIKKEKYTSAITELKSNKGAEPIPKSVSNSVESMSSKSTETAQILPLPMNSFTEVTVSVPIDTSTFWVFKTSDLKQVETICDNLNKHCCSSNASMLKNLTVGSLCSAMFENSWYRAEILATEPEILVRFIDYGNEEKCSLKFIRNLPSDLVSLPPLAFRIKLAVGTSDKYRLSSSLSIKPINKIGSIWTVQVENEIYDEAVLDYKISSNLPNKSEVNGSGASSMLNGTSPPSTGKKAAVANDIESPSARKTIFNQEPPIPVNTFSRVAISYEAGPKAYWVCKHSDVNEIGVLIDKINDFCSSQHAVEIKQPCEESLCLALYECEWYRAKIIATKPELKVFFIDFGNEESCTIDNLRDIPSELSSIPPLVFKIELAEGTSQKYLNLPAGESLNVCPVSQSGDTWIVHVENEKYSNHSVKTVTFKDDKVVEKPNELQINSSGHEKKSALKKKDELVSTLPPIAKEVSTLPPIPKDSYTKVIVTYSSDSGTYWVNKLSDLKTVQKILEDVDIHCKGSQSDKVANLVEGSLCSAFYEGEWYRALVLAVKPVFMVKFIDFGNDDICSSKDIRTLPEELASIPPLAFQIQLAEGTPSKYYDLSFQSQLSVKPVSAADAMWIVNVENEVYGTTSSLASASPVSNDQVISDKNTTKTTSALNEISCEKKSPEVVSKVSPASTNKIPPQTTDNKSPSADKNEPPIPKNVFTDVLIMFPVNNCSYWVISNDKFELSNSILENLMAHCSGSSSQEIVTVKSGMKCAAKYDGEWYRAKVLSVSPLQVKFVDFGNVEDVAKSDIKLLPHEMTKFKPLAFMIKLADDAPKKYHGLAVNSKISVKPESRSTDSSWIVTVPDSDKSEPFPYSDHKISFRSYSPANGDSDTAVASKLKIRTSVKDDVDDSFLPLDCFSKINLALANGKDDYWVYLNSSMKSLLSMTEKLGSLSKEKVIPIKGKTYVKLYEDSWCRAKVLSLNPLKILYVDYGNEEIVSANDLHPLPPEFTGTPPFAFRIKLAEGTSEKFHNANEGDLMSVKPITKIPGGIYVVHVEGENYGCSASSSGATSLIQKSTSPTGSKRSTPSPHSSTRNLSSTKLSTSNSEEEPLCHLLEVAVKATKCDLKVNKILSSQRLCCSLIVPGPHFDQMELINERLHKLKLTPDYSGKVGSMVGCRDKNGIYGRGRLLSLRTSHTPPQAALVDYGYTTEADSMCPLPVALEQLPAAGVSCKFTTPQCDLDAGSILKCSSIKLRGNEVECEVYGRGKCTLSVWQPTSTNSLPTIDITSGSKVVISASSSSCNVVYVQSISEDNLAIVAEAVRKTSCWAKNAPKVTEEPEVGDIVACLFPEDGNYYRAEIMNVKNKKYSVRFLDFGNTCEVTLDDVKCLSDDIKKIPCCSVRVVLCGVEGVPTLSRVHSLLDDHINLQNHFTMIYENLNSVVLESQEGSLNSTLTDIINSESTSKVITPDGRIMVHHVKYVEWHLGTKLDIVILSKVSSNAYMVLHNKDPHLNDIRDDLTQKLSTYARDNFTSDFTYKPVVNEVVIAQYKEDGLWYRASCVNQVDGICEVLFLDFGNSSKVSYGDIRPITQDFLSTPVIIRQCKIHGIPDNVSPKTEEELDSFFSDGSLHEVIVTEEVDLGAISVYHPSLVSKVKSNIISLPPISLPNKI